MHVLNNQLLAKLLNQQSGPCLSISQNTHRSFPDNAQDVIRFKNLVKQLEASLEKMGGEAIKEKERLLAPFKRLAADSEFWKHNYDGLVVLSNATDSYVFKVQSPVIDFAVVAHSWHLKPLLRSLQTADRFQVLAVSRDSATLYEGNRYALDKAATASTFPHVNEDIGGIDDTHVTSAKTHHIERSNEIDKDTENYFRAVDRATYESYSAPSDLPLILVTLPEHQGMFRRISHNPYLLEQGVGVDPKSLEANDLLQRVWQVMEPIYHQRTRDEIERFKQAQGTGLSQDDVEEVYKAALAGRVEHLLVDADLRIPGKLLPEQERIEFVGSFDAPDAEDVLDDIAELVLRNGGRVMVVPPEIMPTPTGVAAVYRY